MPRLNIPLNTSKTARHNRRAVWNLVAGMLILLISCSLVHLWFTRNTLAAYAPEETTLAITVFPTKNSWPVLLDQFSYAPLEQGLTLKQLAPFITKSVAVFIDTDGERTVVFHGQIPEDLKQALQSSGMIVSNPKTKITVISKNEQNRNKISLSNSFWSRMNPSYLGLVALPEYNLTSPISLTSTSLSVNLGKNDNLSTLPLKLPKNTIFAFEVPVDEKVHESPYIPENIKEYLNNGGRVAFSLNPDNNSYQLELIFYSRLETSDLKIIHEQLSIKISPILKLKTLPDGTRLNELATSIENLDIQETILGSMTVLKSNNVISTTNESQTSVVLFSDLESDFVNQDQVELKLICLTNPTVLLLTNRIEQLFAEQAIKNKNSSDLVNMFRHFVQAGLDKQGNNVVFRACF